MWVLASWNVRTLLDVEGPIETTGQCVCALVCVCLVCEVRWGYKDVICSVYSSSMCRHLGGCHYH